MKILNISTVCHGMLFFMFLLALCAAGAVAGKLFLDRANAGEPEHRSRRTNQISGNDNFFGEEDRSDK